MNMIELLNGMKSVIDEALASGKPVDDVIADLNEAWPVHVQKIQTIVEAIANERAADIAETAIAEHDENLKKELNTITSTLTARAEAYLQEAHEMFVKEHAKNLISEAKVELVENFVSKLKETFNDNSIEVDMEAKTNIDQLTSRVDDLQNKLNESLEETIGLKSQLKRKDFELAFESIKNQYDLSETDVTRLNKMINQTTLVESAETVESYKEKLDFTVKTLIKESKNDQEGRLDGTINEDEPPSDDSATKQKSRISPADLNLLEAAN